ncbi:PREDICTED: SERTA domain-containing protein 1 [Nanorana parkeri]|uniref:SERTA domain-containing protein 1 n=1 Tax=Nanorana parkeri TaxID=125878 RepID=UPI000854C801|nr:PREDICTED: SERTA domain-containing protein 1 [Nanorana parkeri]
MLAKGIKRKFSEVEGQMGSGVESGMAGRCQSSLPAVQSHCLMNISLLKLHRSLHHVEPNLRHLVLVANTLRRLQGNMQAESSTLGGWKPVEDNSRKDSQSFTSESKTSASDIPGEDTLLSSMDSSLYSSISTILEDLNDFEGLSSSPLPQTEDEQLCSPKDFIRDGSREESGKLTPSSSLNSSTYLLGDNLEDIFEDIDTSMYDSDPWPSSSLLNFKTFSSINDPEAKSLSDGQDSMLELSDLDYLMDVLVGTQNC